MPTVSMIVPVYNAGEYLVPLLDSIAAQSHPLWECILVDDGSTDGSGDLCDRRAAGDSRFRVLHQPNGGVSAARGAGVAAAAGEYLCFFDSDDLVHPDFVARLLAAAQETGAPILCCRVKPFAGAAPTPDSRTAQPVVWQGEEAVHHLLHDKAIDYGLYNRLFRAHVMEPAFVANGYRFNEDLLANWLALEKAGSMAFVDFEGYYYRQLAGSASHTVSTAFLTQQWQIAARIARGRTEDTIRSFYYEKLLYLYSMILRQDNYQDFSALGSTLQKFIRQDYAAALHYKNLSIKMKLVAAMSVFPPQYYRPVCRLLLRDRR